MCEGKLMLDVIVWLNKRNGQMKREERKKHLLKRKKILK